MRRASTNLQLLGVLLFWVGLVRAQSRLLLGVLLFWVGLVRAQSRLRQDTNAR